MIDVTRERLITLTEACKFFAGSKPGKRLAAVTMRRWANTGLRGVVIETVQQGRTRCTCAQACQRFIEAQTPREPDPRDIFMFRTASQRRRDARTNKALEAMGI